MYPSLNQQSAQPIYCDVPRLPARAVVDAPADFALPPALELVPAHREQQPLDGDLRTYNSIYASERTGADAERSRQTHTLRIHIIHK